MKTRNVLFMLVLSLGLGMAACQKADESPMDKAADAVGDAPSDRAHVQVCPVDGAALFGDVAAVRDDGVFGAAKPDDRYRGGTELCAGLRRVGGVTVHADE